MILNRNMPRSRSRSTLRSFSPIAFRHQCSRPHASVREVIVQLGRKPTSGYIVALLTQLRTGTSLVESEIKEVQDLLDLEPALTSEVLEITRWVADYYAAPWGEVIQRPSRQESMRR